MTPVAFCWIRTESDVMVGIFGCFYQDRIRTGYAVIMAVITRACAVTPAVIGEALSVASFGCAHKNGLSGYEVTVIFVVHQRTVAGYAVRALGQRSLGKGGLMVDVKAG